ncbi:MAG: HAMP domain-containing sensor histidine kinase [Pseudomonadota bacterium]
MKRIEYKVLFAFLMFSTLLGLSFFFAMNVGINKTEDYVLKGLLQGAVDASVDSPTPKMPTSYAIRSRLIDSNELELITKDRMKSVDQDVFLYETKDSQQLTYIRPWPENDRFIISIIDETVVSDFEKKDLAITSLLVLLCLSIVFLSWIIAVWIARKIANPIKELTRAVKNTEAASESESGGKLYGVQREDEIGSLSRAFSKLLHQVQQALRQERSFSYHVSHELRTPLALIQNALTLLSQSVDPHDLSVKRNIERIDSASSRLEAQIKLFLNLGQERHNAETVDLQNIWQGAFDNIQNRLPIDITFDKKSIDGGVLHTNPTLFQALLENSLLNAFQHGQQVEVELSADQYRIRNQIKQRNSEREEGFGCGLSIIERICTVNKWTMTRIQKSDYFELSIVF